MFLAAFFLLAVVVSVVLFCRAVVSQYWAVPAWLSVATCGLALLLYIPEGHPILMNAAATVWATLVVGLPAWRAARWVGFFARGGRARVRW